MVHLEVGLFNIYQHNVEDEVQKEDKKQTMQILYVMLRRLSFMLKVVGSHWTI